MPQDAYTLRYLCEELSQIFSGGKVNRITQPSCDELILTIYTGKRTEKLLLNVNPGAPRMGVISQEKESPLTAPNFCMLMRKHLLSSTVTDIRLIGFDRIVKIDFLTSGEFKDAEIKSVYVELMGRYSNVILTQDGKILGGNRGINMFDNGVRPLIVGKPYVFPPVGNKKLPTDRSLIEIFSNHENSDLTTAITNNVQGIAQTTAKEICLGFYQKSQSSKKNFGERFFDFLNQYLFNTKPNPCVWLDKDDIKDVMVYPYSSITGVIKKFDKLYLAEEFYFEQKEKAKKFKNKKERLRTVTASALKKVKKKLTAIIAKEKDASDAETNRLKGELILSNIYKLKGGEKECILDNYYDNSKIKITLDERLSPAKNAENYYKKYNKQKRTIIALSPQKEQAEKELSYLTGVLESIELCETIEELNLMGVELQSAGLIVEKQNNTKKKQDASFCRVYEVFGFIVKAGRNNTENDKLTFTARQEDVWVHAKDYHSAHVIIESGGKEVPEKVIRIAGEISSYYSKARESGKTEIVYTKRQHVKKPPKSKPGFCTYENFKSLTVEPQKRTEFLKSD